MEIAAGASPRPTHLTVSADSGFGLLPDFVQWTSTRDACPRRERREIQNITHIDNFSLNMRY